MKKLAAVLLASLQILFVSSAQAGSGYYWTFHTNGTTDWQITEAGDVSTAGIYAGPFPGNDPTITLEIGNRYYIYNPNPASHTLQIIARSPGADTSKDIVLLSAGPTIGTMETDPNLLWYDDTFLGTQTIGFFMTQALADAMRDNSGSVTRQAGYRCEVHPEDMRGLFIITGGSATPSPSPSPAPTATATPTVSPSVSPTPATNTRDIIIEVLLGKRPLESGLDLNTDSILDSGDLGVFPR